MNVSVAVNGLAQWSCADVDPPLVLHGGEHVLEDASPTVVSALAAAAASGVGVEILDADADAKALLKESVESDKASLQQAPKLREQADDASREAWAAYEQQLLAEVARIKAEIADADEILIGDDDVAGVEL